MEIIPIHTRPVVAGDSLTEILDRYLPVLKEKDIVAVTSKIVAICEGRIIVNNGKVRKLDLIHKEADYYLEDPAYYDRYHISLTIKDNQLVASSGIDESNGNGYLILWPKDSYKTITFIWNYLRKKHHIHHLGIIITDSRTTPLRWGVTGTTLAWCGLIPLNDYTGKPDIFGRPFKFEKTNVIDSLSTSATLVMGEGNEQTPLALIRGASMVTFIKHAPTRRERQNLRISLSDDIYAPLLTSVSWKKRQKASKK